MWKVISFLLMPELLEMVILVDSTNPIAEVEAIDCMFWETYVYYHFLGLPESL
jgi:hypothetical protein